MTVEIKLEAHMTTPPSLSSIIFTVVLIPLSIP
jgi:hypothetical protein